MKAIKRPKWYRLFARRRWERMFGTLEVAVVAKAGADEIRAKRQAYAVGRKMKGIVGA